MSSLCDYLHLPVGDRTLDWQPGGALVSIPPLRPRVVWSRRVILGVLSFHGKLKRLSCRGSKNTLESGRYESNHNMPWRPKVPRLPPARKMRRHSTRILHYYNEYCPDPMRSFPNMILGVSQQIEEDIYFCSWGHKYFFGTLSNQ